MDIFLPEEQKTILRKFGPQMQTLGYYLAGGTALTIYYQHRLSVDIDWFTSKPMGDVMLLAGKLNDISPLVVTEVSPGTLHALADQVRISFLEYRYPLLQPCTILEDFQCPMASLDDIACMKLSAIAQRGSRKDFIDIYTLIQHHQPLPALLDMYRKKYEIDNPVSVLYGLVYFDDAEGEPLPQNWQGNWESVVRSFREWVRGVS